MFLFLYFILGAILGKLYKIPGICVLYFEFLTMAFQVLWLGSLFISLPLQFCLTELGGKDVEDLFTAVLSPATAQPTPLAQPPPPPAPQLLPIHSQGMSPLEKFRKYGSAACVRF